MPRSTPLIRRVSALVLAVAVVSVSCSGGDNDDPTTNDAADTAVEEPAEPDTDATDEAADESGPEVTATGELELSGALTGSIAEADDYEVAGSLTSEDDPARSVDVDFSYSASIICA